ncbi:UvrD DNA helicase [uncultured virus]|nr:UvrD DNA helicase [uncultured virus]
MNSLNSKSCEELKSLLKKYDLVAGIVKFKKEDLIKTLHAVHKYKKNKQEDYFKFVFNNQNIMLDEDQYKVVTFPINQNIRILACAGSGKTTTLICRIKYLVDQGIDPETILITTFNVDSCENIKNKLIELFGFIPKFTIGTIDSISCRFFHRFFKTDYMVGINEYATHFLNFLKSGNGYRILSCFKYLFFDEFQDINDTQFQILKCFHDYGSQITVIGDDSQNIYQFRGSDVKFILNLDLYFNNLKTFTLINNYRSTPEIINFANASIKFNTEQIQKQMNPIKQSINFLPNLIYFENIQKQNKHILELILDFVKKGINLDQIAIISRVNYSLKIIEQYIEKYNSKNNENKINYISLISMDISDIKAKIKKNHLTLTTIHKSKGLEWSILFVIDLDDTKFPSETDKLSIQEERRLFYVAITRAKQYIYLFFCGNSKENNQVPKLTRFIQEIKLDFYKFINYDKKFYSYDNFRTPKWVTSVTETIKLLNEKDIEYLRSNNIIPKINPVITKIHNNNKINKFIEDYYLQPDFGEFIDRYITRQLGYLNKHSNGLVDIPTLILISSQHFTNHELLILKKYENNFYLNINKINLKKIDRNFDKILEQNLHNLNQIKNIENIDKQIIKNIILKLSMTSKIFNLDINQLLKFLTTKSNIPKKLRDELAISYVKYNDNRYDNDEIKYDVYKISLSNTILNGRGRLMYKNVYNYFIESNEQLLKDLKLYVDFLNPDDSEFRCKKFIKSDQYDLSGEIDLLDLDNGKIIDFKCSSSIQFKIDWLIQLLAYYSIVKIEYPSININIIEIYNPLQGEIYSFDISFWNKEIEYLKYLFKIRVRQLSRNTNQNLPEKLYFPLKYENDLNDSIIFDDSDDVFDLKKLMENNFFGYYWDLKKNRNYFKQYDELIDKFIFNNSKYYVIFDTETTGLPLKLNSGNFYEFSDLEKYDSSRLIQICWAIYLNGKLLELKNYYIKPEGFVINNSEIHGITQTFADLNGKNIVFILKKFANMLKKIDYIIGHNINFDLNIMSSELFRFGLNDIIQILNSKNKICTMEKSICLKIKGYLSPSKLIDLYKFLFNKPFDGQHNAKFDVLATGKIFHELFKRKLIDF